MNNELNKEAGVLILEGDDLFGKEKFKEALERYESACEKSEHYLPLYKSGLLLGYLGRHQDAINKFEEAYPISAYRDKAKICCNWGIALDKLGRYEEAISRLSRAIELIPSYGKAYYYLATVFEKLGQSKQAENMFEDCIISGFDEVSNFYVDEHEEEFFKFSRINKHTLTSMSNKQIFFQIPKNFNDPFDSPLIALSGKDTELDLPYKKQVIDRVRVFSMGKESDGIKPFSCMLMWSHYADQHKGVCIGYKFHPRLFTKHNLCLRKVDYVKNLKLDFWRSEKMLLEYGFFQKYASWQYEHEARIIWLPKEKNDSCIPLSDGIEISSVTFDHKASPSDIALVRQLLGDKVNYFKAEYDGTEKLDRRKIKA